VATALYAGSFDPAHLGHVDIIEQAARCFDRVVVGVLVNPQKRAAMFTASDRVGLLRKATEHLPTVTATTFTGLTVDLAQNVGAAVLVRAAHKEARQEYQMAAINRDVGSVPTVFFPASPRTAAISSSVIRTLVLNGHVDAAQELVPLGVAHALAEVAARLLSTAP